MEYGTIALIFILKLILHGCKDSILCINSNNIFIELFVADVPIRWLKPSSLHQRWGKLIFQVVHLTDALRVLEDADSEWFYNVIVNIFDVFLEDAPVIFPHALPQLKPNIFLKFNAYVPPQVNTPQYVVTIFLHPIPELIHGNIFPCAEHPLIPRNTLLRLLAFHQDCLVFSKSFPPEKTLHVINPFINIHRGGDL